MKIKENITLTLLSIALMILAACGSTSSNLESGSDNAVDETVTEPNQETYEISAAHGVAVGTSFDLAMHKFKELVEDRTDGQVNVNVHPGAELGAEPDLFQGLTEGTVDVMITAPGSLGDFVPELSLFDLAFLIEDSEHQRKVTQGEVGEALADIVKDKTGVITMGYGGGAGRSMYFTEPATSLDDIQGREFRALPTAHPFFNALGLNATYLAHPEIYTGLQQGVIDGGENEPFFTISEGFSEAAPNYLLTEHDITVRPIMISPHTLDRIPEEFHTIILEAGKEAADYEFDLEISLEQEAIKEMQDDGVNVVELNDKSEWIEKVEQVWYEWAEEYDLVDLLEKIIALKES